MPVLGVVKIDLKTVSKAHTLQTFGDLQLSNSKPECVTCSWALLLHAFWDRPFKHLWVWCVLNVTNCYVSHLVPQTHVLTYIHILMTVKKKNSSVIERWETQVHFDDRKWRAEKYMFTSTFIGAEGSKQQ